MVSLSVAPRATMYAEFNRGHVDRIRIFRGPTAEAQWPKGMFLIYRTVADFLFYQYNRM